MTDSLDLTRHSIAEVPGKRVSINGCSYVFESLIGEGAEAFVYPLRNERSQLIWFVGKIYKFPPGSAQAEGKKRQIPIASFKLKLLADVITHTEFYETGGALLLFQQHLGNRDERPNHEAFCESLVRAAEAEQDFARAILIYDQILERNPAHHHAMNNKAFCLANCHRGSEALKLLDQAREIEPNDPWSYRMSAEVYCRVGQYDVALDVLEQAMARCPWDLESWLLAMSIATHWDLHDKAAAFFADVEPWLLESATDEWRPKIEACRARRVEYDTLLNHAVNLQDDRDFAAALAVCEAAQAKSANNLFARINRAICLYHLGRGAECLDDLIALGAGSPNKGSWLSWVGLTMLCAHDARNYELARGCARALAESLNNPWDAPAVPNAITSEVVLETKSSTPIESVLRDVLDREADAAIRGELNALLQLYRQRSAQVDDLPGVPRRGPIRRLYEALLGKSANRK